MNFLLSSLKNIFEKYKSSIYRIIGVLCISVILCGGVLYDRYQLPDFYVAFLDVGQGDAILLSEGHNQILIDGGSDYKKLLSELGQHMPFWDRTIEVVISTHPDMDHMGGLVDLFSYYTVLYVVQTGYQHDTQLFTKWKEKLALSHATVLDAATGTDFLYPSGASLSIIYPFTSITPQTTLDSNDTSVTTLLKIFDESFLFTGDLSSKYEEQLPLTSVTVLKAGHHGSKTSTSQVFLDKIHPRDVIISVGKNNRYKHPSQGVLDRLKQSGVNIFRTDEMGTIVYHCEQEIKKCLLQDN